MKIEQAITLHPRLALFTDISHRIFSEDDDRQRVLLLNCVDLASGFAGELKVNLGEGVGERRRFTRARTVLLFPRPRTLKRLSMERHYLSFGILCSGQLSLS